MRDRDGVQSPLALEQERQWRAVESFGVNVPGDERHAFVAAADTVDDVGEDVGEFWADTY